MFPHRILHIQVYHSSTILSNRVMGDLSGCQRWPASWDSRLEDFLRSFFLEWPPKIQGIDSFSCTSINAPLLGNSFYFKPFFLVGYTQVFPWKIQFWKTLLLKTHQIWAPFSRASSPSRHWKNGEKCQTPTVFVQHFYGLTGSGFPPSLQKRLINLEDSSKGFIQRISGYLNLQLLVPLIFLNKFV